MNHQVPYRFSLVSVVVVFVWIAIIAAWLWSPLLLSLIRSRQSITLFVPPLVVDPRMIAHFEKETGIKVHVTYFENPATLLSKMNSSQGRGYDLIFTDDHIAEKLIKRDLLKPVDKTKLSFLKKADDFKYEFYYDPELTYTIPYSTIVYGIAYHQPFFQEHQIEEPRSWSYIFDPPFLLKERICMTDDAREAMMLAAQYLYGDINQLKDPIKQQEIVRLLRNQKEYVDIYSLESADNLIQSGSSLISVMVSSDYRRLKAKYPDVAFTVPQEGSFIGLYSFAMVKRSEKEDLAYQLLEYLFRSEVMLHHIKKFGYAPFNQTLREGRDISPSLYDYHHLPLGFFKNVIPDSIFNDLWIQVLS